MKKIIVTGGAGFIASHICDHLLAAYPSARIVIVDKLTYAGNMDNLSQALTHPHIEFIKGDVCDFNLMMDITKDADWVIHAAAESNVEHSFLTPLTFSQTNVIGTHTVMECCRQNNVPKIFHISSDEVYGEIPPPQNPADEAGKLNPTTPYSASKGAADLIIQAYRTTYKLPVTVIRPCNIYGTRQYPEKVIPKFCMLMVQGKTLPIQGNGQNSRFYLSVTDFCKALLFIEKNTLPAGIYNVSSVEELTIFEVAELISAHFNRPASETMQPVEDRVYHDSRYFIDDSKLRHYGWKPEDTLPAKIREVADWYKINAASIAGKMIA